MTVDAITREKETQEALADSHKKLADARRAMAKKTTDGGGTKEEVSAADAQVRNGPLGADVQEKRKAHDLASRDLKAWTKSKE